eukprot:14518868-Heterocapsa_arctica.AAC.1
MDTAEALREGVCQQPPVPGLPSSRRHTAASTDRMRCLEQRQGPVLRQRHPQRKDERHWRTDLLGKGPIP